MDKIDRLAVRFRGRKVGTLSLTPDGRLNVFEYDKSWIIDGFSISRRLLHSAALRLVRE